ncbi:hypothetical protein DPMN_147643 [Dreissena polymorpha]|uniref:Uncharacterized protein n=1 Tax=Dreissena polymorpha TaxID=45954 RepID=A0A9D4F9D7_DREPO|nr:hypothetical protein DPMN_147643 [Dreissena polymorpha]
MDLLSPTCSIVHRCGCHGNYDSDVSGTFTTLGNGCSQVLLADHVCKPHGVNTDICTVLFVMFIKILNISLRTSIRLLLLIPRVCY